MSRFRSSNIVYKRLKSQEFAFDCEKATYKGIGKKLLVKMREECIFTALDFVSRPDYWIKVNFGKHGSDLKAELTGNALFKVEKDAKAPSSIQQTSALKEFSTNIDALKISENEFQIFLQDFRTYVMDTIKTKDFENEREKDLLKDKENGQND